MLLCPGGGSYWMFVNEYTQLLHGADAIITVVMIRYYVIFYLRYPLHLLLVSQS